MGFALPPPNLSSSLFFTPCLKLQVWKQRLNEIKRGQKEGKFWMNLIDLCNGCLDNIEVWDFLNKAMGAKGGATGIN